MTAAGSGLADAAILLLRTAEHVLLILLPPAAAFLYVINRGWRDVMLASLVAVAALGAAGYLAFWCWWLSPLAGFIFSCLLPLASAAYCAVTWRALSTIEREHILSIRQPFLLLLATTMLVLATGFLHGGLRNPLVTAAARFSHQLPPDNGLPLILADQIRSGRVLKPMAGEWSSSDRPPLQTGIVLSEFPLGTGPRTLASMIIGVLLQTISIFVLYLFLQALGLNGRLIALTLAAVIFSGFFFVNSFFVWPKLLAAAYMLGFAAMLLTERFSESIRRHMGAAILAGALLTFGLLSHGSSFFALLGLVPVLFFFGRKLPLRSCLIIGLSAALLYLPWILYQKFFDPPGDRLIRYHLVGEKTIDQRPLIQAIVEEYHSLTWQQVVMIRKDNLGTVFDKQEEFWSTLRELLMIPFQSDANFVRSALIVRQLRVLQFFHFATTLGLLMPGPLFLLAGCVRKYRSATWRAAACLLSYALATLLIWCAAMFAPGSTILHQGTYVAVLLTMAGSVMAVWVVSPRMAFMLVALQVALTTVVYGVYGPIPVAGVSQLRGTVHYGQLVIALLSLASVMVLLRQLSADFNADWNAPDTRNNLG